MTLKIGIPRALAYYAYYPFWRAFFEGLGHTIVLSATTTKQILDNGVKDTVSDACVPIKLFHGHVNDLRGKADYIFIPRLISMNRERTVTFCPKFIGLPDMIRTSMSGLPPILDARIDLKKSLAEMFKICYRLGKVLDAGVMQIIQAYRAGIKEQAKYQALLEQQRTPVEAISVLAGNEIPLNNFQPKLRFAVLGFPYTLYDKFVNVDLINKLRKMRIEVLTAEMIPPQLLLKQSKKIPKKLFWNFSNLVLRAALHYIEEVKVDGIIHVTAFGCGPDAMVDKMIELEAKHRGKIPFMSITIDEHTGEAGMITRLEAYADMLLRRELS